MRTFDLRLQDSIAVLGIWLCRAGVWGFDSTLGLLGGDPACMTLGKLHSLRALPEEVNNKPLLNIHYLGNPEKSEWTSGHMDIV